MHDDPSIDFPTGDGDDLALREALRALPLATPNASVLPALKERLARRRRTRARSRWLPLAAAAAACALALSPLLRQGAPQPPETRAAVDPDLAALIAQNQVYESALHSAVFAGRAQSARTALAGAEIEDLIGMLDLELAATGDQAQARDLWRQRVALMQELAAVRAGGLPERMTADNAAMQAANWQLN